MTNGIVLLNLDDRNAAEFSRLEVPGSYDKALGALTAGAYINVYKWQYQGFALTASICTVEDMETYLLLKDKTKGGELRVYPDDTVYIDGTYEPRDPYDGTAIHIRGFTDDGTYYVEITKGTASSTGVFTPGPDSPVLIPRYQLCHSVALFGLPYVVEGFISFFIDDATNFFRWTVINDYVQRADFDPDTGEFDYWTSIPVNWNLGRIDLDDVELDYVFRYRRTS